MIRIGRETRGVTPWESETGMVRRGASEGKNIEKDSNEKNDAFLKMRRYGILKEIEKKNQRSDIL